MAVQFSGSRRIIRNFNPGPWHLMHSGGMQSYCGRRLASLNADHRCDLPPSGERMCAACDTAMTFDTPVAYRKK